MVGEDLVVAAITKEGTAELSNIRRCLHPARRFRVEIPKFLQFPILFLRQKLNAHRSRHIHSGIFWLVFFPCLQRFAVVTNTSAAFRTFR